ncbi:MAG: F0F1 ATP synthase subunit B [Gemmatimonadales bacterium]
MKKQLLILTLFLMPQLVAAQEESHAASGPLVVNGGLVIWTLVVFGLLLFILKKWAWPPMVAAVEAREKALEEMVAEAERNRAESARLLAEHQRLVAEGRTAAHNLLADAKTAAEKERTLLLEKARQEQEELLARALRDIAAERDRAVEEIRREAVDVSLAAAAKLIGQRLDSDADRRLVEEYLGNLDIRH